MKPSMLAMFVISSLFQVVPGNNASASPVFLVEDDFNYAAGNMEPRGNRADPNTGFQGAWGGYWQCSPTSDVFNVFDGDTHMSIRMINPFNGFVDTHVDFPTSDTVAFLVVFTMPSTTPSTNMNIGFGNNDQWFDQSRVFRLKDGKINISRYLHQDTRMLELGSFVSDVPQSLMMIIDGVTKRLSLYYYDGIEKQSGNNTWVDITPADGVVSGFDLLNMSIYAQGVLGDVKAGMVTWGDDPNVNFLLDYIAVIQDPLLPGTLPVELSDFDVN